MNEMIRVVLADDHATTRWAMRLCLKQAADIDVVGEAENGRQAVALVGDLAPDVVVMDIHMPEMDGLEAIRVLRQTRAPVKIIAVSSVSMYARDALMLGADMFLPKSQAFTQLRDAVLAVMGKGQQRWLAAAR